MCANSLHHCVPSVFHLSEVTLGCKTGILGGLVPLPFLRGHADTRSVDLTLGFQVADDQSLLTSKLMETVDNVETTRTHIRSGKAGSACSRAPGCGGGT